MFQEVGAGLKGRECGDEFGIEVKRRLADKFKLGSSKSESPLPAHCGVCELISFIYW